jgi:hypothetical protein
VGADVILMTANALLAPTVTLIGGPRVSLGDHTAT